MKLVAIWLIALYLRHSNAGFTTFVRKIFHRSTKSIRTTSKLTGLSNITSSYEENLVVTLESKNSELFEEVVHLRHLTQKQKKLIQTLKVESSKSKRKIVEIEESHKIELKALANKLESDFELRKQRYLKSLKSEFGNKFKDQIKELKASHKLELEEIKKELAEASEVSTSSESKRQKEIEKLELKLEKSQEQIKELLQLKESKKQSGKQHEVTISNICLN